MLIHHIFATDISFLLSLFKFLSMFPAPSVTGNFLRWKPEQFELEKANGKSTVLQMLAVSV